MLVAIVVTSVPLNLTLSYFTLLGESLQPERGEASLDLGELQQVLQDEELAHKLQDEEEQLLRRVSDSRVYHDKLVIQESRTHDLFLISFLLRSCFLQTSQPSPRISYPEGDFRVAQVAQDEVR